MFYKHLFYKLFNMCLFDSTAVAESGKVGPGNRLNHTNWLVVVMPTGSPKSVRNCS